MTSENNTIGTACQIPSLFIAYEGTSSYSCPNDCNRTISIRRAQRLLPLHPDVSVFHSSDVFLNESKIVLLLFHPSTSNTSLCVYFRHYCSFFPFVIHFPPLFFKYPLCLLLLLFAFSYASHLRFYFPRVFIPNQTISEIRFHKTTRCHSFIDFDVFLLCLFNKTEQVQCASKNTEFPQAISATLHFKYS
jgi:hypothetical protein